MCSSGRRQRWPSWSRPLNRRTAHFAAAYFDHAPSFDTLHWLPPIDEQDVAAGVTYERSRAPGSCRRYDVHARAYTATRPEIFFKARVCGSWGRTTRLVSAATRWNVPEPEFGAGHQPGYEIVGVTIGNDMSSCDIEGENPLACRRPRSYRRVCGARSGYRARPVTDGWPATRIAM